MTDDIIWEDPPDNRYRPELKWIPILTPLMAKPEKWARVATYGVPSQARSITHQLTRATYGEGSYRLPDGQWEFVSRALPSEDNSQQQYGVFARYLGR